LAVCRLELRFGDAARPDPVAALDLVGVRHFLAGQLPRDRLEPDNLGVEPTVRRVEEARAVLDERGGLPQRFGVDLLLQFGRPVVRVDEPVEGTAEPKAEPDVVLRHRSKRAACPCPPPTQSVASPYRPLRRRS